MHVNRGQSLVLKDSLGPEILLGFWIKRQVLHRELAFEGFLWCISHLKVTTKFENFQ